MFYLIHSSTGCWCWQVGAVVFLYNYYYRKQHQDQKIEFLNFASFCQLAVVLKPTLMTYMKLMHRSVYTDVDNLESQLSLTEKEIMRACDISSTLDDAEVVPLSQKWPTSKVAVFLIDSRRENCLLMHSSMTCAVWSIIEKHLDVSSSYLFDSKCISKKKKANMFSTSLQYADGSSLQDLALSAATEATGICLMSNHNSRVLCSQNLPLEVIFSFPPNWVWTDLSCGACLFYQYYGSSSFGLFVLPISSKQVVLVVCLWEVMSIVVHVVKRCFMHLSLNATMTTFYFF